MFKIFNQINCALKKQLLLINYNKLNFTFFRIFKAFSLIRYDSLLTLYLEKEAFGVLINIAESGADIFKVLRRFFNPQPFREWKNYLPERAEDFSADRQRQTLIRFIFQFMTSLRKSF